MSVAFYPVLQSKIAESEQNSVAGNALGKCDELLTGIAKKLNVKPLMSFFGADMTEFLIEEGVEINGRNVNEIWFDAGEGLKTIRSLLKYIKENPKSVDKSNNVIKDLESFERILAEAEKQDVKWHLEMDF